MEEYDEAEIVWPYDGDGDGDHSGGGGGDDYSAAAPAAAARRMVPPSAPIRIARVGVSRSWGLGFGGGGEEAAAPHVVAARRSAAASVCVGHGRTLKGRDLTHFRNSILRMTGFLEM